MDVFFVLYWLDSFTVAEWALTLFIAETAIEALIIIMFVASIAAPIINAPRHDDDSDDDSGPPRGKIR